MIVQESKKFDSDGRHQSAGVAHPVERHLAKVEVASSSLVTRSTNQERIHAFLISIWYRSQVVRPRSAKPLFASSNLAGTSKKDTHHLVCVFFAMYGSDLND